MHLLAALRLWNLHCAVIAFPMINCFRKLQCRKPCPPRARLLRNVEVQQAPAVCSLASGGGLRSLQTLLVPAACAPVTENMAEKFRACSVPAACAPVTIC